MKEFIQKYQKAIIGTGAVSVLLICYYQQKELSKLRSERVVISTPKTTDSLQKVVDSLETELFMSQTMNGRYELSLEHLHEVNQNAGLEFQRFMETETE